MPAHSHNIVDMDRFFIIDPETRAISVPEGYRKTKLVQYDHDSERYTFEIPRYVEGHDMSVSTMIQIHYLNVSEDKLQKNADVYQVSDIQVVDEEFVNFSWLISRNATQLAGLLSWAISFTCVENDVEIYKWNTTIYPGVEIAESLSNGNLVVEQYSDLLNEWYSRLFGLGDTLEQRLIDASIEQQRAIEQKGEETLADIPGDLTALQADINGLKESVHIDLSYGQNEGYFVSGGEVWIAKDGYITSDPIQVDASIFPKLHISFERVNKYVSAVAFSEKADTSRPTIINITMMQEDVFEYEIDIPANAKYMFVAVKGINGGVQVNYCKSAYFYLTDLIQTLHVLSSVTTETIANGAVTFDKQSFIEMIRGNNIYDQDSMIKATGKWYSKNADNIVKIVENQYTGAYTCVDIPIDDTNTNVTMSVAENAGNAVLYNYFFTDNDSFSMSAEVLNATLLSPIALTIPAGATHLKLNISNYVLVENKVMVNYGDMALGYEKFYINPVIDGIEVSNAEFIGALVKEEVEGELSQLSHSILKLPRKFDLIVGDTFEMFYKGISDVIDSNYYDYELSFSDSATNRGKAWKKKWEWTPTVSDVGTKKLSIIVRDNFGKEVDNGTVDIIVHTKPSSPSNQKVILCIGDSLTVAGTWCSELRRRMIASDGTPTGYGLINVDFIGTKENPDGCKYEGYGGWSFNSYLTANRTDDIMNINGTFDKTNDDQHSVYKDTNNTRWMLETIGSSTIKIIRVSSGDPLSSAGTLVWVSGGTNHSDIVYTSSEQADGNPFWNASKSKNDFIAYAERMGVSSIDHAIILLGWNSRYTAKDEYKALTKRFIDGLLDDYPECKITLLGLEVPARDGLANNYGVSNIDKYYHTLQHVWNLNELYQDVADEYDNVEFVNISGQFDTENNMPEMNVNVNARNSKQVTIQSNGIHPATTGYLQIADAALRNICTKL